MSTPSGPLAELDGVAGEQGRRLFVVLFPHEQYADEIEQTVAEVAAVVEPALMTRLVDAVEHGMIRTSAAPLLGRGDRPGDRIGGTA